LQPVAGRPPSSIGDEIYKWEDILNEMTLEERRQLIISSIHPPYPFEFDMKKKSSGHNLNDDDEVEEEEEEAHLDAIICGALKDIGKIHLFEQTRHYPRVSGEEGEEESNDMMKTMTNHSRRSNRKEEYSFFFFFSKQLFSYLILITTKTRHLNCK
jgi:hypothetical protein